MMHLMRRILCAALSALMLISCLFSVALSDPETSPAPDIRVLLRRLNLTDQADLVLDGVYTAGSGKNVTMAFPRGAHITVTVREGQLYLSYEGMNICVGNSLRLTRNASGDETDISTAGGLRFAKDGPLYPGHLSLTIENGILRPILTLSVEDYLLGVVPYEMSDSFPVEALKAQAVCARTYALSKVDPDKDYDVVDTTNDQVFKGYNPAYTNAFEAVRATAGVVGTYQGKLAICYYGASNGGQTELVENVWSGRGAWGFYQITDDPYDLENPESLVRSARLKKDGTGLRSKFMELIAQALSAEMTRQNFLPGVENLRIDEIISAVVENTPFEAPSRYVTDLTLTVRFSGKRMMNLTAMHEDEDWLMFPTDVPEETPSPTPSPTPAPTPYISDFMPAEKEVTVTLSLFPDVADALGLTLNTGTGNELVTIVEEEDAFVLESRRFGHGVGMSQRGAQWMAGQYGKTFTEIMAFYYPGLELMCVQAGDPALPTPPPALAASPAPPATPTPRPTLMPVTGDLPQGAYLATVHNIDDDSSLNLRAEPSQASEILMRLYKHQQLVVLETCEDPAWVKVKTDVIEGYVMVSFLKKVQ